MIERNQYSLYTIQNALLKQKKINKIYKQTNSKCPVQMGE